MGTVKIHANFTEVKALPDNAHGRSLDGMKMYHAPRASGPHDPAADRMPAASHPAATPDPQLPEVDPDDGTEPDGTPVDNPSGRGLTEPVVLDDAA